MRIGIIGAGSIGGTLARKLCAAGHSVLIANSRGPESLAEFAGQIGATAVPVTDVVRNVDIVIISVPQKNILDLPAKLFDDVPHDVAIIDTGNYYPFRDGIIEPIESGMIESRWVEQQLGRLVVKAFNSIIADSLMNGGRPKGAKDRIALSVASDDQRAKKIVIGLLDEVGFDGIDGGNLDESWRQQPGAPAYCTDLDAKGVQHALSQIAEMDRPLLPERRDLAIKKMFELKDLTGPDIVKLAREISGLRFG